MNRITLDLTHRNFVCNLLNVTVGPFAIPTGFELVIGLIHDLFEILVAAHEAVFVGVTLRKGILGSNRSGWGWWGRRWGRRRGWWWRRSCWGRSVNVGGLETISKVSLLALFLNRQVLEAGLLLGVRGDGIFVSLRGYGRSWVVFISTGELWDA